MTAQTIGGRRLAPAAQAAASRDEIIKLRSGRSLIVTDESDNELFSVNASGDAVKVNGVSIGAAGDAAAFADGLSRVRLATATYDFAEHGGAISPIDLGVTLPAKALVLDGMIDVITTLQTAGADAGTIALKVENANDLVTAIAVSDVSNPWDAGFHAIKPLGTSTTVIKTSVARAVTATIAGQVVTAGKFVVFLRYVLSL